MQSFQWNKNFETGLFDVDEQHHQLVDKINNFSNLITNNDIHFEHISSLFNELADYAAYHFNEEEALMISAGIDSQHLDKHIKIHQEFIQEVCSMFSIVSENNTVAIKRLLDFLTHWLAYHILGTDQNMARQIESIQQGATPKEAFEQEEKEASGATKPLLFALNNLFHQVSERNKELLQLNQSLEEKVAKRTKDLSEANLHLEELALTDTLTGLSNRRHCMGLLEIFWKESVHGQTALSCVMIDADHFKVVNDNWGHDAGDLVLKQLAKTLQNSFRNDDIVCRLGGDEFLVICPNTDLQGGLYISEQVRKIVSDLKVPTGETFWNSSVSVGVASREKDMKNMEELIKMADKSVYIAKKAGKNCVKSIIIHH